MTNSNKIQELQAKIKDLNDDIKLINYHIEIMNNGVQKGELFKNKMKKQTRINNLINKIDFIILG